jgi:3'-5' exoribonuclease
MLKAGVSVDDIFVARDKQLANKKNGEPYLTLTIVDRSGGIKGVVWDNVKLISKGFATGDYVRLKGNVSQYRDTLQLVVRHIEPVDVDQIDARDFLPATDRDVDQMFDQLIQISKTVENKHLAALLDAFFSDESFFPLFKKAPAAKKMHHAYLGGLLEHTLSIVRLSQTISGHYKGVDSDLLIAGGVLHDIGKVHELLYETHIDYSDSGRLLSHIVIGVEMLEKKIATIHGFPEELSVLLKHMVISHHGTREFGSPEPPKTLEAIILYYLDDLDAKVTGVRSFMDAEDPEAPWTSYHRLMERFFYRGRDGEPRRDNAED